MLQLQRDLTVTDIEGRTLLGRALSYNRAYTVSDDGGRTWYQEGWRPGSLARSLNGCRNAFELREGHGHAYRIGLVSFDDSESELRFRAAIDDSEHGNLALERVEAGNLSTVSVGFHPERQELRNLATDPIWRTRASIRELSLARQGQYPDAKVLAVREARNRAAVIEDLLAMGAGLLSKCSDIGAPQRG